MNSATCLDAAPGFFSRGRCSSHPEKPISSSTLPWPGRGREFLIPKAPSMTSSSSHDQMMRQSKDLDDPSMNRQIFPLITWKVMINLPLLPLPMTLTLLPLDLDEPALLAMASDAPALFAIDSGPSEFPLALDSALPTVMNPDHNVVVSHPTAQGPGHTAKGS
jgi:hypothetical protein